MVNRLSGNSFAIETILFVAICCSSMMAFHTAAIAQHSVAPSTDFGCIVSVDEFPSEVIIEYDPFLAGSTVTPINFRLVNEGVEECTSLVAVSSDSELPSFEYNFSTTDVAVELNALSNDASLRKTKTEGVFQSTIAAEESREFAISVVVTEDSVAAAGDHRLPLMVSLKTLDGDPTDNFAKQQVDLVLRAKPRAQVNISGATGGFGEVGSLNNVDFGIAKMGKARRVFVQMRANTSSVLTIESQNRGVLTYQGDTKLDSTIAYEASLGDEPLDLSKGYEETYDVPKTFSGTSLPLDLTLGDPSAAAAGRYADIITIEFSPL